LVKKLITDLDEEKFYLLTDMHIGKDNKYFILQLIIFLVYKDE
jgi:hypothetical protein